MPSTVSIEEIMLEAAKNNNLNLARQLLEQYEINEKTLTTGLYHATSTDMAQLLLDNGANVNGYGAGYSSPLHVAVNSDNYHLCATLLQNSADPNHLGDAGDRPLHLAQQWPIAHLLIMYEATPDAKNNIGATPLHSVLDPEVAKVLIENDANVNARDEGGCTPLYRFNEICIKTLGKGISELEPGSFEDQIVTVLTSSGAIGACMSEL